jgi:hypothetical protein
LKPSGVGRPARTFVDRARDICWAQSLFSLTGTQSPSKLREWLEITDEERALAGSPWRAVTKPRRRRLKHFPTPSVVYKYLRGEAGPSQELVAELAALVPGTDAVYRHPLWHLAASPDLSSSELAQVLSSLPASLTDPLISEQRPPQQFWRRSNASFSAIATLVVEDRTLDGAAVALALVNDAVLIQDENQHFAAWRLWATAGFLLYKTSIFTDLFPNFYALVARRLQATQYVDTALRERLGNMVLRAQLAGEKKGERGFTPGHLQIFERTGIGRIEPADYAFLSQLLVPSTFPLHGEYGDIGAYLSK